MSRNAQKALLLIWMGWICNEVYQKTRWYQRLRCSITICTMIGWIYPSTSVGLHGIPPYASRWGSPFPGFESESFGDLDAFWILARYWSSSCMMISWNRSCSLDESPRNVYFSFPAKVEGRTYPVNNVFSYENVTNGSPRNLELRSDRGEGKLCLWRLEYFFHNTSEATSAITWATDGAIHASFCHLSDGTVRELEDNLIQAK